MEWKLDKKVFLILFSSNIILFLGSAREGNISMEVLDFFSQN